MKAHSFFTGYLIGVFTIIGCASVFPYKYYTPSMPDTCYDQGSLLGKLGDKGWPDLPLDECKPDAVVKAKCIVVIEQDFFALQGAYEKCQSDLTSCQHGPPPAP